MEYGIVDLFNTYITLLIPIFNWQFENGLFRFMLDYQEIMKTKGIIFNSFINEFYSSNILHINLFNS